MFVLNLMWLQFGCESEKTVPNTEESYEVLWYWNDTLVEDTIISMPTIRQYLEDGSGVLSALHPSGESLVLEVESSPEWITVEDINSVAPGEADTAFRLFWDRTTAQGSHTGILSFIQGDGTLRELSIEGRVDPYIQLNRQSLPELYQSVQNTVDELSLVGAAVAVVEGQDIVFLEGFGFANLEEETPVDPEKHLFRWASVAKGMAGVLALQLVEEGRLDMDVSIGEYYSYYSVPAHYLPVGWTDASSAVLLPDAGNDIHMRHLLSHTSCIQHYSNGLVDPVPPLSLLQDPMENTGMEWALEFWVEAPLICIPDSQFNYSTFGYNLAGVVLEGVTATPYGDLVTERISSVVDATTILPDLNWAPEPNRVTGYFLSDGEIVQDDDTDVSWKLAAGGFNSTPEDFARYCAGLMGEVLLTSEQKESELWFPQPNAGSYALGFDTEGDAVFHSGSQESTKTAFWIDKNARRCIIAMTNSTWVNPWDLVQSALNALD